MSIFPALDHEWSSQWGFSFYKTTADLAAKSNRADLKSNAVGVWKNEAVNIGETTYWSREDDAPEGIVVRVQPGVFEIGKISPR